MSIMNCKLRRGLYPISFAHPRSKICPLQQWMHVNLFSSSPTIIISNNNTNKNKTIYTHFIAIILRHATHKLTISHQIELNAVIYSLFLPTPPLRSE
eukprot:UN09035